MGLFRLGIAVLALAMLCFSSPAQAQFEDLGGILEDILGGGQLPGQTPIHSESGIEDISAIIRYDGPSDIRDDYSDYVLIVTAYVPNEADGGTRKPKMLGQTRLLMTGLTPPLQIAIAVPRNVTKDLTFSRITAEVLDENENQVLIAARDGIYRGKDTPELTLIPSSTLPATPLQRNYVSFETISGEVSLNDREARLNGGTLTLQLLENALAGGTSLTIAAEKTISIEGAALPIAFTLDHGVTDTESQIPLAFKAWITDWAGRKTHVMRRPVPYNGPDINYKLKLDVLALGSDTRAGRELSPNLMTQAVVSGDALFDVRSGLPTDARLKVTLSRAVGAIGENRLLSTQTIIIRGFEGRVPFALSTASTNFDPLVPAPLLNLQIIDRNGGIYFDSGYIRAKEGPQAVQLYARRN
ncbi:MAG: hypothetical protein ABJN69_16845 [Hellea sp.]